MSDTFDIEIFADDDGKEYVPRETFDKIFKASANLIEDMRVALRTHDRAKQQACIVRENKLINLWKNYNKEIK